MYELMVLTPGVNGEMTEFSLQGTRAVNAGCQALFTYLPPTLSAAHTHTHILKLRTVDICIQLFPGILILSSQFLHAYP